MRNKSAFDKVVKGIRSAWTITTTFKTMSNLSVAAIPQSYPQLH